MNFSFYIYGTPKGTYNQYPNDYTSSLFKNWHGDTNARLVIFRREDLVYYSFAEQINERGERLGFCIVFNRVQVLETRTLISFLRKLVQTHLLKTGEIVRYAENGEACYHITHFNEVSEAVARLREMIDVELETNEDAYRIEPLLSDYNGEKSSILVDKGLSDSEITSLFEKYNQVIVEDLEGGGKNYVNGVIKNLYTEKDNLYQENQRLKADLATITKQKKQYKMVFMLAVIVVVCCIGLYTYSSDLEELGQNLDLRSEQVNVLTDDLAAANSKNDTLNLTLNRNEETIAELNELVVSYRHTADSLTKVVNNMSAELNTLNSSMSLFRKKVLPRLPLLIEKIEVTNCKSDGTTITNHGTPIYANKVSWLSFRMKYEGVRPGKVVMKIKLYKPDGKLWQYPHSPKGYSYSVSTDVSHEGCISTVKLFEINGHNGRYFSSGTYKIEIWHDDMCLKSQTFSIR